MIIKQEFYRVVKVNKCNKFKFKPIKGSKQRNTENQLHFVINVLSPRQCVVTFPIMLDYVLNLKKKYSYVNSTA